MKKQIDVKDYLKTPFSTSYVNQLTTAMLKESMLMIAIAMIMLALLAKLFHVIAGDYEPVMIAVFVISLPVLLLSSWISDKFFPATPRQIIDNNAILVTITADSLAIEDNVPCEYSSPQARALYRDIRNKGRFFYAFEVELLEMLDRRHHQQMTDKATCCA